MAAELVDRVVKAPSKDWLSQREVCEILDVSETTLDREVAAGRFPRPVIWPGQNKSRWRWEDVAWYVLGRQVAARLVGEAEAAAEGPADPRRGPPGAK